MALNGLNFGDFSENMWKMVPPDHPPPPPTYGKFHMFFAFTIWKLPLECQN